MTATVARSEAEAERISRGEDVNTRKEDQDAAAEAIAAAGEFFDPEALDNQAAQRAEETPAAVESRIAAQIRRIKSPAFSPGFR